MSAKIGRRRILQIILTPHLMINPDIFFRVNMIISKIFMGFPERGIFFIKKTCVNQVIFLNPRKNLSYCSRSGKTSSSISSAIHHGQNYSIIMSDGLWITRS